MRVPKYKDIARLTLYGRYDKLINDTTSIYPGYDRALTTTTGGGINSLSLANTGTVFFNLISSNSVNKFNCY
jgi:hypothetical protein